MSVRPEASIVHKTSTHRPFKTRKLSKINCTQKESTAQPTRWRLSAKIGDLEPPSLTSAVHELVHAQQRFECIHACPLLEYAKVPCRSHCLDAFPRYDSRAARKAFFCMRSTLLRA